jgi:hypothetical protein
MHPMPMMTDAANEKIVRRDMITVLPRLPKKRVPAAPLDDFGTSCAKAPQPASTALRLVSLLR